MRIYFIICTFLTIVPLTAVSQDDFWEQTTLQNTIVSALAFKPPNLLFATDYHTGYVCRTTDGGATWAWGLTDDMIYSLTVNSAGFIFAGGIRLGLFRSADDGNTWVHLDFYPYWIWALTTRVRDGAVFASVLDLTGEVLGVWKSSDDGLSWSECGLAKSYVTSLLIPSDGSIIAGTSDGGILRSDDEGGTWVPINTGLSNLLVRALAQDSAGNLYAGTGAGVFRSTNSGGMWQPVNSGLSTLTIRTMIVDPAGTVYCAAWNSPGQPGEVFRSTNHGDSWYLINSGLTTTQILSFAMTPDGYVYAGSAGGGLFRSAHRVTSYDPMFSESPSRFFLDQNFPNPFNPSTRMRYDVPRRSTIVLTVYNLLGQEIAKLVNEVKEAGSYEAEWNATGFSSGVYICRMQASGYTHTTKLLLVR